MILEVILGPGRPFLMAAHVRTVVVADADRQELRRRARSKGAPAREVERARIVLLAAEGVPGKRIAAMVGCAEPTVVTWRRRYAESGLALVGYRIVTFSDGRLSTTCGAIAAC
jgi:hypothetical protein